MNNTHNTEHLAHQEASMLLPWYVNKTLQGDEHIWVEKHLKSCLLCRRELIALQKLAVSVSETDDITPVAVTSFAQLKKRIHTTGQSAAPRSKMSGVLYGYRQWLANHKLIYWTPGYSSLALATLLIFSFSLFIPYFLSTQQQLGNEFKTLSSSTTSTTKDNEIRVVFSNNITPQQIAQILSTVKGKIVAGPTPHGVYTASIGKENITPEEIIQTVVLLRKNTDVIFAEPAISLFFKSPQKPG